VTQPRRPRGKAKALSHEEIVRVDRCLSGTKTEHRDRLLLYLGLGSGMRIGELCQLTTGHVAPFGRVLDEIVLDKHTTKEGRSRTVFLSPQAIQQLKAYLAYLPSIPRVERLIKREGALPLTFPLFSSVNRPFHPLSPNAGVKILSRMFEQAAVSGASSHSMRRTHANNLRRSGADLKLIQEQLGHSSLTITERYFDVDPLEKKAALARLRF
jgi:integrase/recombinase XerD